MRFSRRHLLAKRFALLPLIFLSHGCSTAKEPAITAAPTGIELPGKFVWHDRLTGEPAAAQRFYSGLFRWEFQKSNAEYTVVTQAGRSIGGILDTRKGKAGGRVLIAPTPKIRDGRVALIQDPTGAAVAIQEWEAKP